MNPRVVSVGALYLDVICEDFPFGDALWPERKVVGSEYDLLPGGSAVNFACTTARLEMPTTLFGKTGLDMAGRTIRSLVGDTGVDLRAVGSPDVLTNMSINFNGPDKQTLFTSVGTANGSLMPDEVLPDVETMLDDTTYLYFGGCLKLEGLLPELPALARKARAKGVKVIVDHGRVFTSAEPEQRRRVQELCKEADFYVPSVDELIDLWDAGSIEDAASKVAQATDAALLVKNGSLGVEAFVEGNHVTGSIYDVNVVNPVGAGDSFNAGFIRGHADGLSLAESLDYGCATAALKISRKSSPTQQEVEQLRNSRVQ